MPRKPLFLAGGLLLLLILAWSGYSMADDATADDPSAPDAAVTEEGQPDGPKKTLSKDPPGMKRLQPDADVWIDPKNKRVVMDGVVCLRAGTLEMLACLKGTKEHEAVIAVDTKAFAVHAALLAVGAKAGTPVRFQPTYQPATGTPIDITLVWKDEKGKEHHARAQDWVRNLRTRKPLDYGWVFAGSGFFEDEDGQKHYLAEGGDFICVSNFPGAMLDLPVESSQGTADLLFEAYTEHIPPRGTKVRLVLTPRLEK
jgi:hypothetical protein